MGEGFFVEHARSVTLMYQLFLYYELEDEVCTMPITGDKVLLGVHERIQLACSMALEGFDYYKNKGIYRINAHYEDNEGFAGKGLNLVNSMQQRELRENHARATKEIHEYVENSSEIVSALEFESCSFSVMENGDGIPAVCLNFEGVKTDSEYSVLGLGGCRDLLWGVRVLDMNYWFVIIKRLNENLNFGVAMATVPEDKVSEEVKYEISKACDEAVKVCKKDDENFRIFRSILQIDKVRVTYRVPLTGESHRIGGFNLIEER
jgi:hypothetical protein